MIKEKHDRLLLQGPSEVRIRAQGYITQSKFNNKTTAHEEPMEIIEKNMDMSDTHKAPETPELPKPKGSLTVKTHGLVKQKAV